MSNMILFFRRFLVKPRKRALVAAFSVLVLSLLAGGWLSIYNAEIIAAENRQNVENDLEFYKDVLSITLHSHFALLEGIHSFVSVENEYSPEDLKYEFQGVAGRFYERSTAIRNFSVAPGGVQAYVYPLKGNEMVVGHDLMNDTRLEVRVDVARAIQTGEIALSGPYELRQGGMGLVVRKAIYTRGDFWGFVAMVVDIPAIISSAGLDEEHEGLIFALQDEKGNVFWGDESILEKSPVSSEIILPDQSWTLLAIPKNGWDSFSDSLGWLQIIGTIAAITLSFSTYLLFERDERLRIHVEEKTQALKEANIELEESRASFQQIIAESPTPTIIADNANEKTEYFNKAFIETFGYTVEDVPTQHDWWLTVYPDEAYREQVKKVWHEAVEEAFTNKTQIKTQEWDVVCKDGTTKHVLFDMMPVGEKAIIVLNDITDRRKTEQELQESERRFRSLFADSADAYLIIDNNLFVDCNQATLDMLRASSKEEVLNTHPSELSPEHQPDGRESVEKADEMMKTAVEQGSNRFEWLHRRLDGEVFPAEVLLTPISIGDKTIIHTVWRDITQQKEYEETLRQNAFRLRRYFDQEYLGMAISSADKKWIDVNNTLCRMFGYSRDELLARTWADVTHPEDLDDNATLLEQVLSGERDSYSIEKRFIRKDGSTFHVKLSASVLRNENGSFEYMVTIINDITEWKNTEEALKTLNIELDERIGQRTRELHRTISAMADREIRMAEMKQVITKLRAQLRKAGLNPEAYDPLLGPDREW